MPPVIAAAGAVANAIAGVFFAVGGAIGLSAAAASTFAVFAVNTLAYATNMYLLSRVSKAMAPKAPRGGIQGGQGMEVNYYDSAADGRILIGDGRVGGAQIIPPITTGANNEYLHQILALAIHEIDSFGDVYFDQDLIENGWINGISGADNDGLVSTSASTYANRTWIRRYTGTPTQTVDFILNAADATAFPSTFRGRGIAYAALRYQYDDKVYRSIPNATFEFSGLRCYDPRLDSTQAGGAGSHRYTDPTTWAISRNPAIVLATLAITDMSWDLDPATEIVWSLVQAAANLCDEAVDIPGSTTQPRYTCNGVLLATADPEVNAQTLADAMMGRYFFRDGRLHIYAGAYTTPSFAIEKADWIGPLTIQTIAPRGEGRWNGVRCFFVDADNNYQRKECFARTNATYTTQDGGERIWIEMERPLCNDEYEAQRHAEMTLRQSRNQIRVTGRLPPRFQTLGTFETGTVTFDDLGWASKIFRLLDWDLNEDGSVSVALIEEQEADWDDMAAGDYGSLSTAALPATNPTSPTAPQSFSVTPQINGTLLFEWARSVVEPLGSVYQIIRSVNSASAAVGTVVWEGAQAQRLPLVMPTSPHWYYMRARAGSYYSAYTPNTFGIWGVARQEANATDLSYISPDHEFRIGPQGSYWLDINEGGANSFWYEPSGGPYGGYLRFTKTSVTTESVRQVRGVYDPSDTTSYAGGYRMVGTQPAVFRIKARLQVNSAPLFISFGVRKSYFRQSFGWVDGAALYEKRFTNIASFGGVSGYELLPALGAYVDIDCPVIADGISVSSYDIHRIYPSIMISTNSGELYDLRVGAFSIERIYPSAAVEMAVTETSQGFTSSNIYRHLLVNPFSLSVTFSSELNADADQRLNIPLASVFHLNKITNLAPWRIVANSPMQLDVGTTLVHTVTLPASLYSEVALTKLSNSRYTIRGYGY